VGRISRVCPMDDYHGGSSSNRLTELATGLRRRRGETRVRGWNTVRPVREKEPGGPPQGRVWVGKNTCRLKSTSGWGRGLFAVGGSD